MLNNEYRILNDEVKGRTQKFELYLLAACSVKLVAEFTIHH